MAKPSNPPPSDAELIYTCSVDTALGPRDVRLYWGNVAAVPQKKAVTIVSSIVYQPRVTGQAWRAMTKRFPALEGTEDAFQTIIECDRASSLWPLSPQLEEHWDERIAEPKFKRPSVLVSPPVSDDRLRRVFVLRTLPQHKTDDDMLDYKLGLRACFSALCAQESFELAAGDDGSPYGQIVLSPLSARQGYPLGGLLSTLISEAGTWLRASPRWHSVDIAYWKDDVTKEAAREHLFDAIGEVSFRAHDGSLQALFEELTTRVSATLGKLPAENEHEELRHALVELSVTLQRPDRTVTEIGTAAGRLAEALVNWLSAQLGMARPKDFCSGIEALGARSYRSGNKKDKWLSQWFKSYLHTLRILRNESAHSQSIVDRGGQFPHQLDEDDLTVLAASLKRVLTLHEKLIHTQETS